MRAVLGVDANFDGVSAHAHVALLVPQRLAAGDADHLAHEIDPCDHLRHGMLDLDAGIHLDEIEAPAFFVVEIFQRSGAPVADGPGEGDGRGAQRFAHVGRKHRGRRFLPDFLPTALERAFPLVAVNSTHAVAENLHFDMASIADEFFQIEPAVPEGRLGFGGGLIERRAKRFGGFGDADAAPAAARRSLDHDGKADFLREHPRFIAILNPPLGTGYNGHARPLRRPAGRGLVAHGPDRLAFRTDENQPGRLYRFREDRDFRKESHSPDEWRPRRSAGPRQERLRC